MKVSTFHPWGRVLKALRIVDRIQFFCDDEGWEPQKTFDEMLEPYIEALRNPYKPESVKLLTPFLGQEKSWPSAETCEMAAEIMADWDIVKRN